MGKIFIPGQEKSQLYETLAFYDVNRLAHFPVEQWIKKFKSGDTADKLWAVRSRVKLEGSLFIYGYTDQELFEFLSGHCDKHRDMTVCESMYVRDNENLICNGEIAIRRDPVFMSYETGTGKPIYGWHGWVNYRKGFTGREASRLETNQTIRKFSDIPNCLIGLVDLITGKRLIDMTVEFSLYNAPVGIQNRQLLIWEIRKY